MVKEEQPFIADLYQAAITLLQQLIAQRSFSREEDGTASIIQEFLQSKDVDAKRHLNNIWAISRHYDEAKPTILLNSHHDTVKPNPGYTRDPFHPLIVEEKLFGLGSNDAGGALVSLILTFVHFYQRADLPFNLLLAATAEEEISGTGGIQALLPHLPPIYCGLVGEPTLLQLALAERGLLVIDAVAKGRAGHAARNEGENALYKAMNDIEVLRKLSFEKVSDWIGPVKLTVTSIETPNKAHNVVPDECRFIIDVRINEHYTHEVIMETLRGQMQSELSPRSCGLRATAIALHHPLVQAALKEDQQPYGSPTSSDKALLPFPALKFGPGDSARSHTADEYIYLEEIRKGIKAYIDLLERFQPAI